MTRRPMQLLSTRDLAAPCLPVVVPILGTSSFHRIKVVSAANLGLTARVASWTATLSLTAILVVVSGSRNGTVSDPHSIATAVDGSPWNETITLSRFGFGQGTADLFLPTCGTELRRSIPATGSVQHVFIKRRLIEFQRDSFWS
jgi:hypothetical protein